MSSRARSGTPTGLAAGRRSRSTRSARATTQRSTAASRANRAGRESEGGRVRVSDAPAKKWWEVMRPPAAGVKFSIPTWVQVEKLTAEERQDYENALEAEKRRKEEANKVVAEPIIADSVATATAAATTTTSPTEGSVQNEKEIANDPGPKAVGISDNVGTPNSLGEQNCDTNQKADTSNTVATSNNPEEEKCDTDQKDDNKTSIPLHSSGLPETEEPPLKRAKFTPDDPSATVVGKDLDPPIESEASDPVPTTAVEDEEQTGTTTPQMDMDPGDTNSAAVAESSDPPAAMGNTLDPPEMAKDEAPRGTSQTNEHPAMPSTASSTERSALAEGEASPPDPAPSAGEEEGEATKEVSPKGMDTKPSESATPEGEASTPGPSKTIEDDATTSSTGNQPKAETEMPDKAYPEGEGQPPEKVEDPPTAVSQMDPQTDSQAGGIGEETHQQENNVSPTTNEDDDNQEKNEESTRI